MRAIIPILSLLFVSGTAQAEPVKLLGSDILALLSDVVLTAADNGKEVEQIFQKAGVTLYSVAGSQSQGFWHVEADKYCSQWPPNQSWSCYEMTQDGNLVTFVSANGKRFVMNLPTTP